MKRLLGFVIGGFFLATAGVALAAPPGPGQHFDCSNGGSGISCASDDTGCVPDTKDHGKCSDGIAKAFSKAIATVIKCHAKQADAAWSTSNGKPKTFDEEACETSGGGKSAKEKLDAAIAKLAPLCTATQLSNATTEETALFADKTNAASLDAQNAGVYCQGTNDIDPGGDDAGKIPDGTDSKNVLKCEDTVGKNLSKLIAATIKCHIKLADSDSKGVDFDEESCEGTNPSQKGALDKFNQARDKLIALGICPTCLNATGQNTLASNTQSRFDTDNQLIYPCPAPSCAPIVVGQAIPHTYKLQGTTDPQKRCTTNSASNRFGTCSSDTDCGGTAGACMQLPWVTADGQIMPFSIGTQTTFTVNTADSYPTCEHALCIPCGNANAPCAGIPGCEVAGNPNGCVPRGTQGCCNQPAFIVPTFFVNILGGLCSRVDQIGCGGGVVNTSQPQTGHNKVAKQGDTSDPGADCCYNGHPTSECLGGTNLNDDPTLAAQGGCTTSGAGNDYKGKITKTVGGGATDADGIQFRYSVPELSTTWTDGQSPPGSCANGSTYDDGELLVSQLILKADTTTSGASGSFTDQNGDGCKRAGAGYISSTNPATDGPITVPGAESGGPARPQAYDASTGSIAAAVSVVFSGPSSPIRDIGFVAITPQQAAIIAPNLACSCTVQPDCPE